jgi:hypothetical protein
MRQVNAVDMLGVPKTAKSRRWISAVVLKLVFSRVFSCRRWDCSTSGRILRCRAFSTWFRWASPVVVHGFPPRSFSSDSKRPVPSFHHQHGQPNIEKYWCLHLPVHKLSFADECRSEARFLQSGTLSIHAISWHWHTRFTLRHVYKHKSRPSSGRCLKCLRPVVFFLSKGIRRHYLSTPFLSSFTVWSYTRKETGLESKFSGLNKCQLLWVPMRYSFACVDVKATNKSNSRIQHVFLTSC